MDDDKMLRILLLSRMANGGELFPDYEASDDEVDDLCPAIAEAEAYALEVATRETGKKVIN